MPELHTLIKSLNLLETVAAQDVQGIGTRELARQLGLNIATAHNIAMTFKARGYLDQSVESKRFTLGPRLSQLAASFRPAESLRRACLPAAQELFEQLKETVMVVMLEGNRMSPLINLESPQALTVRDSGDFALAVYGMATGKLLLAAMPEPFFEAYLKDHPPEKFTPRSLCDARSVREEMARIRRQDYAMTRDELCEGVSALAVPVRDASQRIVAALGVSAPTMRFNKVRERQILDALRKAAARIQSTKVSSASVAAMIH
ncbi:MAG: IclR family transcriptional regulator [Verrucomicrobiae bacterium]|nr:IclR family transcriptional regulator [Verrucomicrobiae bacterium]